jgi:hypothetical protein
VTAVLSALTPLSWTVGYLYPDVFMGVGILCLYLLIFLWDRLAVYKRVGAAALLFISTIFHLGNLPCFLLMALCGGLLRNRHQLLRITAPAWITLGLSFGCVLTVNYFTLGKLIYSRASNVPLVARLVGDGIIQVYLKDRCASEHYSLCQSKDQLTYTQDEFLWTRSSPLYQGNFINTENWVRFDKEYGRMIRDSVYHYPWLHLKSAITGPIRLFGKIKAGDDLLKPPDEIALQIFKNIYPNEAKSYDNSGQAHQQNGISFFQPLDFWVFVLACLASLVMIFRAIKQKYIDTVRIHLFGWSALLINAAVFANFSGQAPRYATRIAWIPLFCVLVSILERTKDSFEL